MAAWLVLSSQVDRESGGPYGMRNMLHQFGNTPEAVHQWPQPVMLVEREWVGQNGYAETDFG